MTYRITGLAPEPFAPRFALDGDAPAMRRARRVIADSEHGFPCGVSLEDARAGDELLLVHHTHHRLETPYLCGFAIHVRCKADAPAMYRRCKPPVFAGSGVSLRAFASDGRMARPKLAAAGEADAPIRALLAEPSVAYSEAHNAAAGCFAARIERDER